MAGLTERSVAAIEDAEFIAEMGGDMYEAAQRLGYNKHSTLMTLLYRAGRRDVANKLQSNCPPPEPVRVHAGEATGMTSPYRPVLPSDREL